MSTGPVELQGITINAGILETLQGFSTNRNVLKGITIGVGTGAPIMQLKVVDRNHEPIEGATCRVLNAFGESNNVLSFDGVDDRVVTTKNLSEYGITRYATISCLVKITQTGRRHDAISDWTGNIGFTLRIRSDQKAEFYWYPGNYRAISANVCFTLNTWHRYTAVADFDQIRLYVDNVLVASTSLAGNIGTSANKITFGNRADLHSSLWFKGELSDVWIFTSALTQGQINTYAEKRLKGNEANLAEYWKLDEGTGTLVSGLTNNGTIYGATWQEEGESFPLYTPPGLNYDETPYDTQTTNANGLTTLNYQINQIHGLEVTLPGKRRFIMPFERTTRGFLDWQVMLSDYLATFATDGGNILINAEPENNDSNFLIE